MTNEELALQVQAGSAAALEELYLQSNGLLCKCAHKLFFGAGGAENHFGMEYADAQQIAFLGLYGAAMAYDENKGFKFNSYLWRQTQRAFRAMYYGQGKDPLRTAKSGDEDLAGDTEDLCLWDTVPDESAAADFENCEYSMWVKQAGEDLAAALASLPAEQSEAIHTHFVERVPVFKLAMKQGCTRADI
jgi:RNA polymerase sigma factor (sigma-70 family)